MSGLESLSSAERLPIRIGGLMRCCTRTWGEYEGPEDEGTVLPCRYCSSSMIVRGGAWEWNYPPTATVEVPNVSTQTTPPGPSRAPTGTACDRRPLCDAALATNRELREKVVELEALTPAVLLRERDEARAEADACRIYLWQRLPWRGYAS